MFLTTSLEFYPKAFKLKCSKRKAALLDFSSLFKKSL